jgi:hypothetical protein
VTGAAGADSSLRILAVTQGQWGERIAENITANAPSDWSVQSWAAPRVIPPIVDDPEEFLPETLPRAELVLALGDVSGLYQLIPDVARMVGAKAVIAPIDRNSSLPKGLAIQLESWLEAMGVASVFPKPFCSLTEGYYNRKPLVKTYDNPLIQRFAAHFGKPEFRLIVEDEKIVAVEVQRDSACGCAKYVADNLLGVKVDEAVEKTGMLHHHFPCLASMNQDRDYNDTLMHVSGHFLQDAIREGLGSNLSTVYIQPVGHVSEKP